MNTRLDFIIVSTTVSGLGRARVRPVSAGLGIQHSRRYIRAPRHTGLLCKHHRLGGISE